MLPDWNKISDDKVRHVWFSEQDINEENPVYIDPSFYADSGIPIDSETGDGLIYSHTEVLL